MGAPADKEVVVVGGGPAGLAAAIAVRQAGFNVTVFDAAMPPIDKACGEGIMPQGVAALHELGIRIDPRQAVPFRGIRFLQPGTSTSASFEDGCGYGIRRTTLQELLVERAARLGVCMNWGARVNGMTRAGVIVNGREFGCRWLIGADGQNSPVRQWAEMKVSGQVRRRFGFRRHFKVEPWSEFVDVHWSDHGQLYVSPVGAEEVCVAFLTRYRHLRFKQVFELFPDVAWRLTRASSVETGAVTAMRTLRSVCNGRGALVGDASGSVDAITGEGLSLAFRQALALACALKNNELAAYERAHRAMAKVPRAMARLLLLMDEHPQLRCRVLRAFESDPGLFKRMLAIHAGSTPLCVTDLSNAVSLTWKTCAARTTGSPYSMP